jgi:BirA family biotin operon repressor/biotin-[acetyl-CoA-carboxylase] ligase
MQEQQNIKASFQGDIIGKEYIHLPTTGSTNDVVFEIGKTWQHAEGVVVTSDRQTAGRGRHWVSPPSVNLYCSVRIPSAFHREEKQVLPLIAAVSVVRAIRFSTDLCAAIKWPNDILLENKKTGGILLETRTSGISYDLIALGIGLNVNMSLDSFPGDIKHSATSLLIEGKKEIDRSALLDDILATLDSDLRVLASGGRAQLLREWLKYSMTIGKTVQVQQDKTGVSGFAEGISYGGELLIRLTSGKIQAVTAGDIVISDL